MNKIRMKVIYSVLCRKTVQKYMIMNLIILKLKYKWYEKILMNWNSNW